MAKIVGIDLGTTNSVIAVLEGGEPTVIPTAEGSRLCPSVVGFSRSGERLVGQLAKRQAVTNPERTIVSIKRKMGTSYRASIDGKEYAPPEISAMILQKLKADAEAYLGESVARAVITVPAYFSDSQRQATKDAGVIAGLDVVRIINEPTAACLAYGINPPMGRDIISRPIGVVLVWDLGGGTFDVSLLDVGEGVFEVRATNGDTMLGGDDWDERIVNWLADDFAHAHGIDLRSDRMALQRLREAGEKAKVELSTVVTTSINLPFISMTADGPVHLDAELTRARLEELTRDLLERMVGPTRQALSDAKLQPSQIERVLLVGGSTRMPAVQELVKSTFHPDREGSETPPYLGAGINPDEVVAIGAAIQGGVLAGEVRDIVLLDVTPLSLGIETLGGVFTRLIERNTTIPTSKTQEFTTAADNQREVDIKVFQGEREMAADNKFLGNFQLVGIQAALRGVPRIEVTFDVDVNGIVHVSAKDKATGKEQGITIAGSAGLKKDEIERMVGEAAGHAADDRRLRDEREARNFADSVVYGAQRALIDADGRVPQEIIDSVRDGISQVRQTLAGEDLAAIRTAADALSAKIYELSGAISPAPSEGEAAAVPTEEDKTAHEQGQADEAGGK